MYGKAKRFVKRAYNSKAGKAVRKYTGNRYGRTKGQLVSKGIPQLYKDVLMLKKMVNAEKKFVTIGPLTRDVGQVYNNTDAGYFQWDITPTPSQGTGQQYRTGSSIKLHSSQIRMQFRQQTNTHDTVKYTIYIAKVVGNPYASLTSATMNEFLLPDLISGVTDTNSLRNPDHYKDFRVIAKKTFYLGPDTYASQNIRVIDKQINLKYNNHHVRTAGDSQTSITEGQLILYVVVNSGNAGPVASTLPRICHTTASTGSIMEAQIRHYFYDN